MKSKKTDRGLDATFHPTAVSPDGQIGSLVLTLGGDRIEMTYAQARALVAAIIMKVGLA
jgi:hypothetical protein